MSKHESIILFWATEGTTEQSCEEQQNEVTTHLLPGGQPLVFNVRAGAGGKVYL